MGKEIGIRAFARLADVSPPAVRKAIATIRVIEGERGIDPSLRANQYFLEVCRYKRVAQMEMDRKVAPGWAAFCLPVRGQAPKPIFYLPPAGDAVLADTDFFDDWAFDDEAWTAIDPDGKIHKLTIVYRGDAPPPWLTDEKKKRQKVSA